MTLADIPQIERMTTEEKLQLVEDLWTSIASSPDSLPVSDEEKEILESRAQEHLQSPDSALSLEEFKRRLIERL